VVIINFYSIIRQVAQTQMNNDYELSVLVSRVDRWKSSILSNRSLLNRTLLIESLNHFLCDDLSHYILYFLEGRENYLIPHPGLYGLGYLIHFYSLKDFLDVCEKGYINLVNWMIKEGFDGSKSFWDWGLRCACEGGHREIVDLMIEEGADDWNWGLEAACLAGHYNLVELMIEKGANDWDRGLAWAREGGHPEIVDLMTQWRDHI